MNEIINQNRYLIIVIKMLFSTYIQSCILKLEFNFKVFWKVKKNWKKWGRKINEYYVFFDEFNAIQNSLSLIIWKFKTII